MAAAGRGVTGVLMILIKAQPAGPGYSDRMFPSRMIGAQVS